MKRTSGILLAAALSCLGTFAVAKEKVNAAVEMRRAIELCVDHAVSGRGEFADLVDHGYRIQERKLRKQTAYKKGVSAELFGAHGIIIHKKATSCKINIFGLHPNTTEAVYRVVRRDLVADGFMRIGNRFSKGDTRIGISVRANPTIVWVYRD